MFGRWGTSEYQDFRVETPDGPGVIKGIRKNTVHVKLNKAPGRPRHYKVKDVRIIDTGVAEDIGKVAGDLILPGAGFGAKFVLKQVFKRVFWSKTGY